MNKFSGFTLAEVLLTLSIIGVVAAMTIPSLMATRQNETYVAGVKKMYSTLCAARNKVAEDNGEDYSSLFAPTDATEGNVLFQAFAPHLNIAKNCGTAMGCLPRKWEYLDGTEGDYDWDAESAAQHGKAILADGAAIEFISDGGSCAGEYCGYIMADVNGAKGPNKGGRDIFCFEIYKTKIVPYGFDQIAAFIDFDYSITTGTGDMCATKILRENAMNY